MGTWFEQEQQSAVDRLKHRPRKMLGFRTPFEMTLGKMVRYTKSSIGVHFEIESTEF
jgi:transposase, IS30 family